MNATFHRAPSERAPTIIVQAYRIPGGAIVRITRRGCVHRYRIGSRRFRALRDWLNVHAAGLWSGFFGRSNFVARRWDGGVA